MKKIPLVAFVLILIFSTAVGVAVAFRPQAEQKEIEVPATNYDVDYAKDAVITNMDNAITLTFPEAHKINTVVLTEPGRAIRDFEIYYQNEVGEYVFAYKQDVIGNYRYCCFKEVETSSIKIEIKDYVGESWEITSIEVYQMGDNKRADDFRVTAYAVSQYTYAEDSVKADHFKAITHVNLISTVFFTSKGEIYFLDSEQNGVMVDGEEVFKKSLQNIRSAVKEGTTIVATLLGQDRLGTGESTIEIHESAFTTYRDTFIANAVAFCNKYQLDGLSFDYEYPETIAQYGRLFDVCGALKEAMGGKLMTVALGTWTTSKPLIFDHAGLKNVDWVESMNYDEVREDPIGNHSSFEYSAYHHISMIKKLNELFSSPEAPYTDILQYNMGLPFYSRPTNYGGYWGDYKYKAEELGKYGNVIRDEYYEASDGKTYDCYYNSYQMIYDKVCYSIDQGIGGVMVWHYSCDVDPDSELSLWDAIYQAVESRK